MSNSTKRYLLGEGIVLVAWLVVMFACKTILMSPVIFALALVFGVLAFAISAASVSLTDKASDSRATTEVNALPHVLSVAYFALALVANTILCVASTIWTSSTLIVVANVVLLAVMVLSHMGLDSYGKASQNNVSAVAVKVAPFSAMSSRVGQLLAATDDMTVKTELLTLKEDMALSPNMSQPHTRELEQQFMRSLDAILASIEGGDSSDTTVGLVRQARKTWRERNAALTSFK